MVKVPVCSSEVTHGVGCVGQTRMNSCVGLLGIAGASRHLLLLPSLQAGCFGVQIPLCGFRDTERILGLKIAWVLFSQLTVSTPHHEHSECNDDTEVACVNVFIISNRNSAVRDYLTWSVKCVLVLYFNIWHSDYFKQTTVTQTVAHLSYSILYGWNTCVKLYLKD